jgi:hypothetical protein
MSGLVNDAERRLKLAGDYLPPCPACSLRSMPPKAPTFYRARHAGGTMLAHCCELSKGSPIVCHPELPVSGLILPDVRRDVLAKQIAAHVSLANWWKMRRLTSEQDKDVRTERQREMLALFRERGLEPEMEATK